MRKEVNYIEEYRELWSDMKSADTTPMPEIVEWRDEMKLCLDYSDLESSQYKLVKNTDKWQKAEKLLYKVPPMLDRRQEYEQLSLF